VRSDALLHCVSNLVSVPNSDGDGPHIVALAVGGLDDNKRLDVFPEAFARAGEEGPRPTDIIVGDGPSQDALTRQAADLGLLPGVVTFLGQIPNPGPICAKADIFVHLVKYDDAGSVFRIAAAFGRTRPSRSTIFTQCELGAGFAELLLFGNPDSRGYSPDELLRYSPMSLMAASVDSEHIG
jgi:glycosyltransferase involved in cell wall biosynthesis